MRAARLYGLLASRGAQLRLAHDDVVVDAPAGVLTLELKNELREAKRELVTLLRESPIVVDFETRSPVKLRTVGARAYAAHPATEVLCFVALMGDGAILHWDPSQPPPTKVFDAIARGVPLVAHNGIGFDRFVWQRLGWPSASWIDTLVIARLLGLPGDLDGLAMRLLGRGKDLAGKKLTLSLSRRDRNGALREIDTDTLQRVRDYCVEDVRTTRDVWFCRLAAARDAEASIREVDRVINDRGFLLDPELAAGVIDCDAQISAVHRELAVVEKELLSSPAKLRGWLSEQGVPVNDVRRATLRATLGRPSISARVRNVINARIASAGIAAPKLRRALTLRQPDGRIGDGFVYFAAHTGRWAGKGFQPHNLPRGVEVDLDRAIAAVLARDVDGLRKLAAEAGVSESDVLATLVRATIIPSRGRILGIVDLSSIEARGLLWLAKDEHGLAVFRSAVDPYCAMASALYEVPIPIVTKSQRQLGKVLVLGCGYQMGSVRFAEHAAAQGVDWSVTPVTPQAAVDAWRDRHPAIAGWAKGVTRDGHVVRTGGFWQLLERAAYRAARGDGVETVVGRTTWFRDGSDVVCLLPSGRRLVYPDARIEERPSRGGAKRPAFTYWQRKTRAESYGGKLAENVTQAVCRDLLADALVRLEAAGVEVVLHVHDEVVAELRGPEQLSEMEAIIRTAPPWASDFPIAVKGETSKRYRK